MLLHSLKIKTYSSIYLQQLNYTCSSYLKRVKQKRILGFHY